MGQSMIQQELARFSNGRCLSFHTATGQSATGSVPVVHEGQIGRPVPPEGAMPLSGSRIDPAHDRNWADSGTAAFGRLDFVCEHSKEASATTASRVH